MFLLPRPSLGPPPRKLQPPLGHISGFAVNRPRLSRPWPALLCSPGCSHPPSNSLCPTGTPSTHHLTPPYSSRASQPGRPCAPLGTGSIGQLATARPRRWVLSRHSLGSSQSASPALAGAGGGQHSAGQTSAVRRWSPHAVRGCNNPGPQGPASKGALPLTSG